MAVQSAAATRVQPRRSARIVKTEEASGRVKQEGSASVKIEKSLEASAAPTAASSRKRKYIKTEPDEAKEDLVPSISSPKKPRNLKNGNPSSEKATSLRSKKLKSYSNKSPFPKYPHPTPDEAHLAHNVLTKLHGHRTRPTEIIAPKDTAGCGNSPSVLDALVRTILSQNTSDKNSSRAKKNMDAVYGGSDAWESIAKGGQGKLQKAIESGGLSVIKSKVILGILEQAKERYGAYSLDHLFRASNEDAMQELISFQGVGPKTASCVLLFCLGRESFAVDTHVHRITGLLGWTPPGTSRDEAHAHLDERIPDELKYPLHVLIISHGKNCDECKAGGKNLGKCELRKAFRKGKLKGEAGEDVKAEEEETVKKEEDVKAEEETVKKEEKEEDEDEEADDIKKVKLESA